MRSYLALCVILSVSVAVYGSVSFRNIRSSESQSAQPTVDGSTTWSRQERRHPIPGYNRTGTFPNRRTRRVPQPQTIDHTSTPGSYKLTRPSSGFNASYSQQFPLLPYYANSLSTTDLDNRGAGADASHQPVIRIPPTRGNFAPVRPIPAIVYA